MNLESSNERIFLDPGTVIAGRYQIIRTIGRGGMAAVYEALDLELENARCALKVLNSEFTNNRDYVDRFIREVQLMHKVQHPNVVKTYQAGSDNGLIYFSLEFVDGVALETLIRRKTSFPFSIQSFILQLCAGLGAIHQQEILHRDLKPANLLICPKGNLKITDFGVARPKESSLTKKNQKVGSVLYMAPEVWAGKPLSPSVDFYSMGILLYEITTGKLPFTGDTPGEFMNQHLRDTPVRPSVHVSDCPLWLDRLIMCLIEKSPSSRPKSTEEIVEFVQLASSGNLSIPKEQKAKNKDKKKKKRTHHFIKLLQSPKGQLVIAALIGLIIAVLFFLLPNFSAS